VRRQISRLVGLVRFWMLSMSDGPGAPKAAVGGVGFGLGGGNGWVLDRRPAVDL